MSAKRYTEEFKIKAVKQVSERGHRIAEVAARLGATSHKQHVVASSNIGHQLHGGRLNELSSDQNQRS